MGDADPKWKGHSQAIRISTNAFTKQDYKLLCIALQNKFDCNIILQQPGKSKEGLQQFRLYIHIDSYKKLKNLFFSELLPSIH